MLQSALGVAASEGSGTMSTADDAQGSGLGLAIASELAERMDGRLTVRSGSGETIFTLDLPADRQPAGR